MAAGKQPNLSKKEDDVKQYVLQIRGRDWEPWRVCREFDTLREAKKAYDAMPFKHGYRIAETYVQVRYKAVRIQEVWYEYAEKSGTSRCR